MWTGRGRAPAAASAATDHRCTVCATECIESYDVVSFHEVNVPVLGTGGATIRQEPLVGSVFVFQSHSAQLDIARTLGQGAGQTRGAASGNVRG